MTDEAYFHLNTFVNKQNLKYWAVWCAIMCNRIIGSYFFENAECFTVTANEMLNTFIRPVVIHFRNHGPDAGNAWE